MAVLENISEQIMELEGSGRLKLAMIANPGLKRLKQKFEAEENPETKLDLGAEFLNVFEKSFWRQEFLWQRCLKEDIRLWKGRRGRTRVIDNSAGRSGDYYSVAVIVRNEARYIREFILFYLETGADRIYIYDNESEDNLLEEIEPFLKSGQAVYVNWPGDVAQNAAYRDAVRRTRGRSRWLALVDADEFLFSVKGQMPDMLKAYEQYPGVGVNWLMFGPDGYDKRPEGLVMDNYTRTVADRDCFMNHHIKSIVQPNRVLLIDQPHYAIYKRAECAVDEKCRPIDYRNAFVVNAGKAFTEHNHTEIFRINHYRKSIEDMREKCIRGFPDGAPNAVLEDLLRPFAGEQVEDLAIRKYADIVRSKY